MFKGTLTVNTEQCFMQLLLQFFGDTMARKVI